MYLLWPRWGSRSLLRGHFFTTTFPWQSCPSRFALSPSRFGMRELARASLRLYWLCLSGHLSSNLRLIGFRDFRTISSSCCFRSSCYRPREPRMSWNRGSPRGDGRIDEGKRRPTSGNLGTKTSRGCTSGKCYGSEECSTRNPASESPVV